MNLFVWLRLKATPPRHSFEFPVLWFGQKDFSTGLLEAKKKNPTRLKCNALTKYRNAHETVKKAVDSVLVSCITQQVHHSTKISRRFEESSFTFLCTHGFVGSQCGTQSRMPHKRNEQ